MSYPPSQSQTSSSYPRRQETLDLRPDQEEQIPLTELPSGDKPSGFPLTNPNVSNYGAQRRWKLWCLLAAVSAVAISIPLGWALRLRDLNIPAQNNTSNIQLQANLVAVDPTAQTMTIDWGVVTSCGAEFPTPCPDVDIFFDQNLLQGLNSPTSTNDVPTTPIFHINGTVYNNANLIPLGNSPFFRTQINLFSAAAFGSRERTLQAYPFDKYQAEIFIFAKTNGSTGDLFPITLTQVFGIAPDFSVKPELSETDGFEILLLLSVTRGTVVRVYSIVIVLAMWLVTLLCLTAAVSTVLLGRKVAKEILAVPVGLLFAFPSLRGTLPGAPNGFGAIIDFMGILPCLAILTFCAVLMLGAFLFRSDLDKNTHPLWAAVALEWKEFRGKPS